MFLQKVLRIVKILFGKCETSLCVLLWQQWFSPGNSPMDAIFGQCLSYSRVVNTDLNWGQRGLQFFGCFSRLFCDLLNKLSSHSWSNLSWSTTPGKVCHCSQFSPFVDNGSDSALLEPHSLGDGFETFSKLIEISLFFSFLLEFLWIVAWCVCSWDFVAYFTLCNGFYLSDFLIQQRWWQSGLGVACEIELSCPKTAITFSHRVR